MTTEIIIKLIIEASAVLIPSFITILTLLKKKFYKHTIDIISQKIQIMAISNEKNLKKIQEQLNIHNQVITSYMEIKQAGQKIRQITKHALEVIDNEEAKKILTKFTEQLVIYVRQILDIGFQNASKEQLISKLQLAIDNTSNYGQTLMTKQAFLKWKKMVKPLFNKYKKDILQVFSDKINNKNNRFLIKSLDISHTIIKQFVLYYASLKDSKENQ